MSNLVGTTLKNQYFLRELVGSGGMADVYLAWGRMHAAKMAVKVLHKDLSEDKRFKTAFEKEAKFLQELNHPYIVRFYDYGKEKVKEKEIVYIVMAWVDGTDLKKRINDLNRPLSPAEVLAVFLPISSALNYTHQKSRYHCDIKPANILLDANGKDVLLADFGVAQHVAKENAGGGTLPYMAPEQFTQGAVSAQTDIYSLGITIYQMLSGGIVPYHGDTKSPGTTVRERYQYEHSYLPLPPLSMFNSGISPAIFPVLQKAASKNPSERFHTMLEFYNAFAKACGNVSAQPPSPREDPNKTTFGQPTYSSEPPQPHKKVSGPHLYVRSGDLAGLTFQFLSRELSIGRRASCDVCVSEKSVSRKHATFFITKKGTYIRDENSGLGTTVNGEVIPPYTPVPIRPGDVIKIGYYQVFEYRNQG